MTRPSAQSPAEPIRVAVIGAGYVGLVTGVGLASRGCEVVCTDRDPSRIARVQEGTAPFHEPGLGALLQRQLLRGGFRATSDLRDALRGCQVAIIAVGTPAGRDGIDLSHVAMAAAAIGEASDLLGERCVVVVKSTVTPGTTAGLVRETLERHAGRALDRNLGVAVNPEFLREGSALADFLEPDRIVIGSEDPAWSKLLLDLYADFECPKLCTTPTNAELIKYASNGLLATLVSFSNEMARFCERLPDANVETVMRGVHLDRRWRRSAARARAGPEMLSYLRAGSGFGGSCLPKDVDALRAAGCALGVPTPLLDAVMEINRGRPADLVRAVEDELGSLSGRTLAVLGLAFKPGTDDLRDSPALRLIEVLRERGARVRAFDPLIEPPRAEPALRDIEHCGSLAAALRGADAAVLITAWPQFVRADWPSLVRAMRRPLLFDGRNQLAGLPLPAELRYRPIGRENASRRERSRAPASADPIRTRPRPRA